MYVFDGVQEALGGDEASPGVGGDQAMATQRSRQPLDECGEHGAVGPVQARSWAGAAEYGEFVS